MQEYFGVFRRGDSLKEGVEKLQALGDLLQRVSVDDDSLLWNVALVSALELENLAEQAVVMLTRHTDAPNHVARMRARITTTATILIG
jgi:succinate dehydrogenase/fumarate reductase flavoprotein subunit